LPGAIHDQELLFQEKRLRDQGTDTTRSEQPGQRGDQVDNKNGQIAHRRIVAGWEILRNHGRNNNSPGTGRNPLNVGGQRFGERQGGITLSYKVIATEAHSPNDWDLMLMVEYKDLASLEANQDKADAMLQKMFGGDEKVMQGYKERSDIREVLGTRLAREIILEPKK